MRALDPTATERQQRRLAVRGDFDRINADWLHRQGGAGAGVHRRHLGDHLHHRHLCLHHPRRLRLHAIRPARLGRQFHLAALAPDLGAQPDLRHSGDDRRHGERHRARDARGDTVSPSAPPSTSPSSPPVKTAGIPEDPGRAPGRHPVGGLGLHRAYHHEPADHRAVRRAGRAERPERRHHPRPDGGPDHDLDRRRRAQSRARSLSRSRRSAGRDPLARSCSASSCRPPRTACWAPCCSVSAAASARPWRC